MKRLFFVCTLVSMCIISSLCFVCKPMAKTFAYSAECYAVMELSSGKLLGGRNLEKHHLIASCTKILTAITVIDEFKKQGRNLDEVITVPKLATNIEGSSIYLMVDEKIKIIDLLYGLMLSSGNDAGVALAIATAKSSENFAKLMNGLAKELGCNHSNFVTPNGLDAEGQFSSALDLALISCYALKNETFKTIVSTQNHTIAATNKRAARYIHNKNKLLKNLNGAVGVKTGYTKKAGRCLVGAAERGNITIVAVVLNCGSMFEETSSLINEAFKRFEEIE